MKADTARVLHHLTNLADQISDQLLEQAAEIRAADQPWTADRVADQFVQAAASITSWADTYRPEVTPR